MIVADANIISYLFLPTSYSEKDGVVCGALVSAATAINIQSMQGRDPENPSLGKYAQVGRLLTESQEPPDFGHQSSPEQSNGFNHGRTQMIHSELRADQGILLITPEGPLQASDFASLTKLVDPYIETNGELHGILIHTQSFPGWADFAALLSHLKFVKDHHQHIAKVAAVTDNGFLAIMPTIVSHFVHAEVRHFDYNDRESALIWLQSLDI